MPPTVTLPPWTFMWSLAVAIFAACKVLTWLTADTSGATTARSFGYFLAWPGLDAAEFANGTEHSRPSVGEWIGAAVTTVAGLALVFGLARHAPTPYLAGWVGMVGLIMTLHFGSFHLLSCGWRAAGVPARPLMRKPFAATSLAEFWGRRWNTAFRDLAHRFLFRPLTPRLGPVGALWAGFLFSGLVHDAVISWPAGGGWGGPTLYFLIQAAGLVAERPKPGRRAGLGRGPAGRVFTLFVLAVPLGLLFHPPFVLRIIVPFLEAIGAT